MGIWFILLIRITIVNRAKVRVAITQYDDFLQTAISRSLQVGLMATRAPASQLPYLPFLQATGDHRLCNIFYQRQGLAAVLHFKPNTH